MANLSNINNILRTGSLGVGINRDPLGAFEISSATKPGIKMFNTAASGKTYEAYSDANGNYIIYDQDADDNRLVINSAGNATFAGTIITPQINLYGVGTTYLNIGNATTGTTLSDGASIGFYTGQTSLQIVNRENDAIVLSTNNSPSVTILGNGNVGIGTNAVASPGFWFDTTNNYLSINKWTASTATPAAMLHLFGRDNDIDVPAIIIEGRDNPGDTRLKIAVKDPQVRFLLDEGSDAAAGYGLMTFETTAQPNASYSERGGFDFDLPGGTAMTILNTGNVGIGTASPTANLNVVGPGDANDPVVAIDVTNSSAFNHGLEIFDANLTDGETVLMAIGKAGSTKNTAIFGYIHDADGGNDNLATIGFWGADNKMTVSAGGNVGIGTGTTTAEQKLHVEGRGIFDGGTSSDILQIRNDNGGGVFGMTSNLFALDLASTSAFRIRQGSSVPFYLKSDGNLGIGETSPTRRLVLDGTLGTASLEIKQNSDRIVYLGTGSSADNVDQPILLLYDAGAIKVNISSIADSYFNGGDVGIGTTGPNQKLEVAGNIRIDSRSKLGSGEVDNITFTKDRPDAATGTYEMGAIRSFTTNGYSGGMTFYCGRHTGGGGYALIPTMTIGHTTEIGFAYVGIGTTTPTGNLTVEASGNQLHLRASTASSGRYWNFDVDSNSRLYIVNDQNAGVYLDYASTSWSSTSDESLKENIKPLNNVLDKIKDYRCVEYNLKSDKTKGKKIGFIAQDWENDFAPIISKDDDGLLGMKYTETIPVLLKAIQELKADNDSLKARIETLENN